MSEELYKKYRPKLFKHVLGQKEACQTLQNFISARKMPHTLLFTGPSGCGKTTLARIIADKMGCTGTIKETNGASSRGIDDMRAIQQEIAYPPIASKLRAWIIDECHKLTDDAQSAMLKTLEDTPYHTYFMLCTNSPTKLLATIRTRSTPIKLNPLSSGDLMELLGSVAAKEKKALNQEVAEKIIETAGSSARMALVLLGQVIDVEGTKEQLAAIQLPETEKQVKELCQLITKGGSFKECAAILKKLKEDPEAVRRQLLGYLNAVLLNNYSPRVFKAIDCLRQDTFHSGMAGLTASIYEIYLK